MNTLNKKATCFLVCVASFFSACVPLHSDSLQGRPVYIPWSDRVRVLSHLSGFSVQGTVRFQRAHESPRFFQYAWVQQDSNNYELAFYAPFHIQSLKIRMRHSMPCVLLNGQEVASGVAVMPWIKQQIGYELPLQWLSYWVKGLPATGTQKNSVMSAVWDHFGRLVQFSQNQVQVKFSAYFSCAQYGIPRQISWSYKQDQVRLVAKVWHQHV